MVISATLFSQVKLTSSIDEYFDGFTWENSSKAEYVYNSNNNLFEEFYFTWESTGSTWEKLGKVIYSYNANNKTIETIYQIWNPSTNLYVNNYRYTYAYNSNGDIKEYIDYTWNGIAWINDSTSEKSIITYNGDKLDEVTTYSYNEVSSQWVIDLESTLTTFSYNGNVIANEIEQKWNGATWVNLSKEIYTYNSNNQLIEDIYQEWNGANWINSDKTTYSFVNGNMTTETYFSYNGEWEQSSKTVNTFDTSQLMSSYTHPFNDKSGVDYLFGSSYIFYNKILNSTESYYFGDTWEVSSKTTYYYGGATAGVSDVALKELSIYPNPTSNVLFIKNNGLVDISSFKIYDVAGKMLLHDNLNLSDKIDLSNLNEGLYFLELRTYEGQTKNIKIYKK